MIATYNVYRRDADEVPVISLSILPEIQMKGKKKYSGKKGKIEAIFRLTGKLLSEKWTTKQVNDYIGVTFFGTSQWNEYHSMLNKVLDERVAIAERFKFLYHLVVTFADEMVVGKQQEVTRPEDERVIYLITQELMGQALKEYRTVQNPIKELRKEYL